MVIGQLQHESLNGSSLFSLSVRLMFDECASSSYLVFKEPTSQSQLNQTPAFPCRKTLPQRNLLMVSQHQELSTSRSKHKLYERLFSSGETRTTFRFPTCSTNGCVPGPTRRLRSLTRSPSTRTLPCSMSLVAELFDSANPTSTITAESRVPSA